MPEYVYFGVEWAIQEHDKIIALTGGRDGVIHLNLLTSAIEFIQNDDYYPELSDKLGHIVFSLAQNHCFVDGNKRSAIAVGAFFLKVNGFDSLIGVFIEQMENVVLWTAESLITKEQLRDLLDDLIQRGEFSEASQLMLFEALEKHNNLSRTH